MNHRCNNNNDNNNRRNNNEDGIKEILEKIVELQKEEVREELQEKFCDNDFLGENDHHHNKENTRPIQVYTDDDRPWFCPVERDEDGCRERGHDITCVFRAEKVENGVVVLRALVDCREDDHENDENDNRNHHHRHERFKSTDSFITIKIADIAAIRCLKDTFINLCIR